MATTASETRRRFVNPGYRSDVVAILSELFEVRAEVRAAKMFSFPAFSTDGKIFAIVLGDGVGLRLPSETIERLADDEITPFVPMGKSMNGWVQISRAEADRYRDDAALFEVAIGHAAAIAANQPARPSRARRARPAPSAAPG